ncbi:hypothetical protein ACFY36_24845 [Actinoplanes sp. NPDC000266]
MTSRPPEGAWTTELLDGVLLVHPSPTDVHQIIAMRLMSSMEDSCPSSFQVTQGVEVRISRQCAFRPDVLAATDAAAQRRAAFYEPREVVLAPRYL